MVITYPAKYVAELPGILGKKEEITNE